jgi:hypothetical protein
LARLERFCADLATEPSDARIKRSGSRGHNTAEALPRNPSGKILKKDLREPYWKGQERHIH